MTAGIDDATLASVERDVTTKETLRRLVDELSADELPAARRFLEPKSGAKMVKT
jgi:hypothetical protein